MVLTGYKSSLGSDPMPQEKTMGCWIYNLFFTCFTCYVKPVKMLFFTQITCYVKAVKSGFFTQITWHVKSVRSMLERGALRVF